MESFLVLMITFINMDNTNLIPIAWGKHMTGTGNEVRNKGLACSFAVQCLCAVLKAACLIMPVSQVKHLCHHRSILICVWKKNISTNSEVICPF